MGAIVTSKFRTQNLMVFIDQFKTTGSVDDNFLYLGFGRSDKAFVAWGNISDIKRILKSRLFFPVYLTGMSGNGKTFE